MQKHQRGAVGSSQLCSPLPAWYSGARCGAQWGCHAKPWPLLADTLWPSSQSHSEVHELFPCLCEPCSTPFGVLPAQPFAHITTHILLMVGGWSQWRCHWHMWQPAHKSSLQSQSSLPRVGPGSTEVVTVDAVDMLVGKD